MTKKKQVKLALTVLAVGLALAALMALLPSLSSLLGAAFAPQESRSIGAVRVASPRPGALEVSWNAPPDAPLDYHLTWARAGESFPTTSDDPGNAFPTTASFLITGLDQGVRYQVRVRARYQSSESGWSAVAEAVVASAPTAAQAAAAAAPGPPQNLQAEAAFDSVRLTWSAPADNNAVSGYQVLRRDRAADPAGQFSVVAHDTGSPDTSHVDNTVLPGRQYTYRVLALNRGVPGANFAHVDADTPAAPTQLAAASTAVPTPASQPVPAAASAAAQSVTPTPQAAPSQEPLQALPTPIPLSQTDALVALYHATGGANWARNANWLSEEPIGTWYGVTTDENGGVTEINLNRNLLNGHLPPALGSLSNLEILRLSGNSLAGPIPVALANLAALTNLELNGNQLDGPIPPQLGNLPNLAWLDLSANNLTGPIPSELRARTGLTVLELSENSLTGIFPWWLKELDELLILHTSGNQLSGCIPADLLRIWIDDLDSMHLPTCREALDAFYFALGGSQWERDDNWRSDTPLSQWFGITTDNDGRVTAINLPRNQLAGTLPARIGALIHLQELDLSDNDLSGTVPPELANLANLSTLYLAGNRLTGCLPASLRQIANNDLDNLGLPFCE